MIEAGRECRVDVEQGSIDEEGWTGMKITTKKLQLLQCFGLFGHHRVSHVALTADVTVKFYAILVAASLSRSCSLSSNHKCNPYVHFSVIGDLSRG